MGDNAEKALPRWQEVFAGLGVAGYRSYGHTSVQRFGPIGNVHLVAGQNNAGKSNALRVFAELGPLVSKGAFYQHQFDIAGALPDGWPTNQPLVVSIGLRLTDELMDLFTLGTTNSEPYLREFFEYDLFSHGSHGVVWFDYDIVIEENRCTPKLRGDVFQQRIDSLRTPEISQTISQVVSIGNLGSVSPSRDAMRLVQHVNPWRFFPPVTQLAAARQLTADDDETDLIEQQSVSGRGLIKGLQNLAHPDSSNRRRDAPRYEAINRFVRDVLDDAEARIDTNARGTELFVKTNGVDRELHDLGSGIEHLVLIAVASTLAQDTLVIIEEPELFLHPSLQRKLLTYIGNQTSNHFLASTHSAHLLDSASSSISHVELVDGFSQARPAIEPGERAALVSDLGYRASDLVQANFLVWVEGPSDRTYIRELIRLANSNLVEGSHYSVMFYGGALLRHLSFDDPEVDDFIKMRAINRKAAVVIDSDIDGAQRTAINQTKQRVVDEFRNDEFGLAWVTAAYTIENYVHHDLLRQAVADLYGGKTLAMELPDTKSPLKKGSVMGRKSEPSKTLIASRVIELASESGRTWTSAPWRLDALEMAHRLAAEIGKANGN